MTASLSTIARALGGEVSGRQILCPGPGHSPRDRSLSVRMSPAAPDGFVVDSFCGDDFRLAKDHVRRLLGWEAFGGRRRERPMRTPTKLAEPDTDNLANIERARQIWAQARDPRGTIVETYLKSRGLELPTEVAGEAIRFHERSPWRDDEIGQMIFVPTMIAAFRSITSEEITGVHRTRLTPEGRKVEGRKAGKASDRRMLGKASGAAIMLCGFSAVGAGLTIGEGIETALSAWQLGWSNTWALGSVGAIASFPVLAGVQTLTLLAETDDGGASAKAINTVGCRYEDAGREVLVVTPTISGDMNDVVQRGAPS